MWLLVVESMFAFDLETTYYSFSGNVVCTFRIEWIILGRAKLVDEVWWHKRLDALDEEKVFGNVVDKLS